MFKPLAADKAKTLKPPCGCKPTNMNTYAPEKGPAPDMPGANIPFRVRPSLNNSLITIQPNVFTQNPAKWSLTWGQEDDQANNLTMATPRKGKKKMELR